MTSQPQETEYMQMAEDCMSREHKMTEWEQGFISSIYDRLGTGKSLTDKQSEILDRIWEKVT